MLNFYGSTVLTGGGVGALDKLDGSILNDKDGAIVITESAIYPFHLDVDSGAGENSPLVISPDANAGAKRWLLKKGVFAGLTSYGKVGFGTNIPGSAMGAYVTHCRLDIEWTAQCFLRLATTQTGNDVTALWLHPFDCGDGGWFVGTNNDGKLRLGYNAGSGGNEGAAISAVKDGEMGITILQNNSIGFGTSTPLSTMRQTLLGTTTLIGHYGQLLLLDDTAQAAGVGGMLYFGGKYTDAGSYTEWAGIQGAKLNGVSGEYQGKLNFYIRTANLEKVATLDNVGDYDIIGKYKVDGTQVVGNQGVAVANATDADSVILRLNELLARCRAHGLIAT